jgi:hypothetical protein
MATQRKRLNAKKLRDAASKAIGRSVSISECADIARVDRRNWQRFELPSDAKQAKKIPDSVIMAICNHFGLDFKKFDPSL